MEADNTLIDTEWLRSHGVQLPEEDLQLYVQKVQSELELRVGTIIADQLNDDQIDEFEALAEEEQVSWLNTTLPEYPRIVRRQEKLLLLDLLNLEDMQSFIGRW